MQNIQRDIVDMDSLKWNLTEPCNEVDNIRKATASWLPRLQCFVEHSGKHLVVKFVYKSC